MLTGAVLGALGGAGIARGLNLARGKSGATLRWDDAFLSSLVGSAVLRYLAVAHYGRGRGDWAETEYPPFWTPLVAEIVEQHRDRLAKLWAKREPACDAEIIASGLRALLADATRDALDQLYPGALAAWARPATARKGATPCSTRDPAADEVAWPYLARIPSLRPTCGGSGNAACADFISASRVCMSGGNGSLRRVAMLMWIERSSLVAAR